MLSAYMRAALRAARYEILSDDNSFYGEIPALQGVWANAPTLEECREELESVLGEWILVCARDSVEVPILDGVDINLSKVA